MLASPTLFKHLQKAMNSTAMSWGFNGNGWLIRKQFGCLHNPSNGSLRLYSDRIDSIPNLWFAPNVLLTEISCRRIYGNHQTQFHTKYKTWKMKKRDWRLWV
jgi:hypothetical protein